MLAWPGYRVWAGDPDPHRACAFDRCENELSRNKKSEGTFSKEQNGGGSVEDISRRAGWILAFVMRVMKEGRWDSRGASFSDFRNGIFLQPEPRAHLAWRLWWSAHQWDNLCQVAAASRLPHGTHRYGLQDSELRSMFMHFPFIVWFNLPGMSAGPMPASLLLKWDTWGRDSMPDFLGPLVYWAEYGKNHGNQKQMGLSIAITKMEYSVGGQDKKFTAFITSLPAEKWVHFYLFLCF